MKVQVLYFAALRERVGVESEELELAEGARVRELLASLAERHDFLRGLRGFRVAVDQAFAKEDAVLTEGAEVALIPPVAGGSADDAPVEDECLHVALVEEPITADGLHALATHPESGAVQVFLGVVRNHHEGRQVLHLEYQAYEAMAVEEMRRIGMRLLVEHPEVRRVALVHRVGDLQIGEASVGVAVSTPHRRHAFRACEWGIDRIKETVPVWKREHYTDGEPEWVRANCMHHAHDEGDAPVPGPALDEQ